MHDADRKSAKNKNIEAIYRQMLENSPQIGCEEKTEQTCESE